MNMERHQMLAFSTSVLQPETLRWLEEDYDFYNDDITAYPKRGYGFFICVNDMHIEERSHVPEDLKRLLAHAGEQGYDWIMLDRDVDPEVLYQFQTHAKLKGEK